MPTSTFAEAETGIRQLYAAYTDAVWRKDSDAVAECFAVDGEWRISGRVFRGRKEIHDGITLILSNFIRVLISFRTPSLQVGDDGTATGRTYIDERCAWKNGNTNVAVGRYYDRFVDEGDRWRFTWRLFELHYRGPPDLTGTFFEHPDYGPPPAMPPLDANTENMAGKRWGLPPA